MTEKRTYLVVGLGNPGETYKETRHNVGFMVIDELGTEFSVPIEKKKFDARMGRGRIRGADVILVKPMAFMNLSGFPTRQAADYFRIQIGNMLIIHDDIDLGFGKIKIKKKGGDGGHKGIRSLISVFGRDDFTRVRIGVGRSETGTSVADHVLSRFGTGERETLDLIIRTARDAVVTILGNGVEEGMNRFNNRNIISE